MYCVNENVAATVRFKISSCSLNMKCLLFNFYFGYLELNKNHKHETSLQYFFKRNIITSERTFM